MIKNNIYRALKSDTDFEHAYSPINFVKFCAQHDIKTTKKEINSFLYSETNDLFERVDIGSPAIWMRIQKETRFQDIETRQEKTNPISFLNEHAQSNTQTPPIYSFSRYNGGFQGICEYMGKTCKAFGSSKKEAKNLAATKFIHEYLY